MVAVGVVLFEDLRGLPRAERQPERLEGNAQLEAVDVSRLVGIVQVEDAVDLVERGAAAGGEHADWRERRRAKGRGDPRRRLELLELEAEGGELVDVKASGAVSVEAREDARRLLRGGGQTERLERRAQLCHIDRLGAIAIEALKGRNDEAG